MNDIDILNLELRYHENKGSKDPGTIKCLKRIKWLLDKEGSRLRSIDVTLERESKVKK